MLPSFLWINKKRSKTWKGCILFNGAEVRRSKENEKIWQKLQTNLPNVYFLKLKRHTGRTVSHEPLRFWGMLHFFCLASIWIIQVAAIFWPQQKATCSKSCKSQHYSKIAAFINLKAFAMTRHHSWQTSLTMDCSGKWLVWSPKSNEYATLIPKKIYNTSDVNWRDTYLGVY